MGTKCQAPFGTLHVWASLASDTLYELRKYYYSTYQKEESLSLPVINLKRGGAGKRVEVPVERTEETQGIPEVDPECETKGGELRSAVRKIEAHFGGGSSIRRKTSAKEATFRAERGSQEGVPPRGRQETVGVAAEGRPGCGAGRQRKRPPAGGPAGPGSGREVRTHPGPLQGRACRARRSAGHSGSISSARGGCPLTARPGRGQKVEPRPERTTSTDGGS